MGCTRHSVHNIVHLCYLPHVQATKWEILCCGNRKGQYLSILVIASDFPAYGVFIQTTHLLFHPFNSSEWKGDTPDSYQHKQESVQASTL